MTERFINPPIKRHPTLQPLSREHFNGLVLARRMREAAAGGEQARLETRGLLASAWRDELSGHFADEERLLTPLVCDCDKARLIEDHRSLQRRMEMASESERAPSVEWLLETADLLEKHIRWEERELFPAAEKQCGPDLDSLACEAARMEEERPGCRRRQEGAGQGADA